MPHDIWSTADAVRWASTETLIAEGWTAEKLHALVAQLEHDGYAWELCNKVHRQALRLERIQLVSAHS